MCLFSTSKLATSGYRWALLWKEAIAASKNQIWFNTCGYFSTLPPPVKIIKFK